MHISQKLKNYLIESILEDQGIETEHELIEEFRFESIVPGICPHCESVWDVEIDCRRGHCDTCDEKNVTSFIELLFLT